VTNRMWIGCFIPTSVSEYYDQRHRTSIWLVPRTDSRILQLRVLKEPVESLVLCAVTGTGEPSVFLFKHVLLPTMNTNRSEWRLITITLPDPVVGALALVFHRKIFTTKLLL
jgi:hypothetical protein